MSKPIKTKSVTVQKQELQAAPAMNVETLIATAVSKGASVETLNGLYELHGKMKAAHAKEAYTQALASFQAQCPIIEKTKKVMNKDGREVRYMYAPLESIVAQVKALLAQNGLSYTMDATNEEGLISATATITHILGHSDTSTFAVPIDTGGYMSTPQKYASALTFAKRYAFCNALGILTGEEDTDATDVGSEPSAPSFKSQIMLSLRALGYETEDKEFAKDKAAELSELKLTEANLEEIAKRLAALVKEEQELDSTTGI